MTFKEKYGDHSSEIYPKYLNLLNQKLTSLEGCYKEIKKDFTCSNNNLSSLKGAPKVVGGTFICYGSNLKSLEGAPKIVGRNFTCANNKLISLKGSPRTINENFWCNNNDLISLEGAPRTVNGDFNCSKNPKLNSLDDLLETEIKGNLISDIITDKEFKEDQKLYNKVNKNLSKYKKLKKLLQATKV